jgi:hypothetical protein
METTSNTNIENMKNMVNDVLNKYTFLEEYLLKPNIITGKQIPTFIKLMSTILYLRRRLEFLVEPSESFYKDIEQNDYTNFQDLDELEIFRMLVCFVILACSYIDITITEEDEKDRIINIIRKYYYKNKDYVS